MALPIITAPRYELKVPSTGKKIIFRPYLVKEEKIIMIASESGDEKTMISAIKTVIHSCTDGAINLDDLTLFDLEYIFIQIRCKSVGETSKLKVKCNKCNHHNTVSLDLTSVYVNMPDKKDDIKKINDDISIKMRYPTVNDLEKGISNKDNQVEMVYETIANSIESVFYKDECYPFKDETREEIFKFIDSFTSDQFKEIQKFIENMPVAKIDLKFNCKSCSAKNEMVIRGMSNFF